MILLLSVVKRITLRWGVRSTHDLPYRLLNYFNIVYEDSLKDGLYLIYNTGWTFLPPTNASPLSTDQMRLHSASTYLRLMPDNFPVRESPRFFYVKMTLGDLVNPNSFILDIAFESSLQIHITLKHNKSLPFYQEQKLNDVLYHSLPYPHIP